MDWKFIVKEQSNRNEVERLQNWLLPEYDHGFWNGLTPAGNLYPGPVGDWCDHHSKKWFYHIKGDNIAIQAGGAIGMYPRLLAQKFKLVYTFEPHPVSFHCLNINCSRVDHILKYQAVLGNKNDIVPIACDPVNYGQTQVDEFGPHLPFIPMFTIDSFKFKYPVDLIALDVEGYEYQALLGAKKTIKKFHPTIIAENSDDDRFKELLTGYKLVDKSVLDSIWVYDQNSS
jgi:FkbM family methyltransferase